MFGHLIKDGKVAKKKLEKKVVKKLQKSDIKLFIKVPILLNFVNYSQNNFVKD